MALRVTYSVTLLIASLCAMTFTHELGHILGGRIGGGTLVDADLLPWHLPYSIFEPDPHPLVTLWCGPIFGVLAPVAIAVVLRTDWMWFIANFCIIANGMYLSTAWFSNDRFLDTPKLLEHGAHPIFIFAYCVITIGIGYVRFRNSCVRTWQQTAPNDPVSEMKSQKNE